MGGAEGWGCVYDGLSAALLYFFLVFSALPCFLLALPWHRLSAGCGSSGVSVPQCGLLVGHSPAVRILTYSMLRLWIFSKSKLFEALKLHRCLVVPTMSILWIVLSFVWYYTLSLLSPVLVVCSRPVIGISISLLFSWCYAHFQTFQRSVYLLTLSGL